jgi:hypothetical protein
LQAHHSAMPVIIHPCTGYTTPILDVFSVTSTGTSVLTSGESSALSRGIEGLLIAGAFASILLCTALLVVTLLFVCRPERMRNALFQRRPDDQISLCRPRSTTEGMQQPLRPISTDAPSHRTSQKSSSKHGRDDEGTQNTDRLGQNEYT